MHGLGDAADQQPAGGVGKRVSVNYTDWEMQTVGIPSEPQGQGDHHHFLYVFLLLFPLNLPQFRLLPEPQQNFKL